MGAPITSLLVTAANADAAARLKIHGVAWSVKHKSDAATGIRGKPQTDRAAGQKKEKSEYAGGS